MADDSTVEQPPDFQQIGKDLALGMESTGAKLVDAKLWEKVGGNVLGGVLNGLLRAAAAIVAFFARSLMKAENTSEPAFAELASIGIEDLFGVKVNVRSGGVAGGKRLGPNEANSIGGAVFKVLTNTSGASGGGELQPSMAGAEGYLSNVVAMVVEGWLEDAIVTSVSAGYLAKFGELDDLIYEALGFGRLSRRVLSPLVDATVVKPAEWQINKTYRPQLLSESLAARQYLRGRISREQLDEELARQGWSHERIEAHINATSKGLSLGDALQLVRHGQLGRDAALQALRDAGYDQANAELALVAEESRRFDSYNDNPLATITRAYVNRDLSDSEFKSFLPAIIVDDTDRSTYESGAAIERALNVKHLSHSEVIDCVKKKILSRVDYRAWLAREGYPPEDAAALELRLVKEIDDQADVEEERARIAAARAADKAAKDAAAAQRKAEVDAERALHRRGAISDLERGVVRGLIPITRLEEVLSAQYDADTVDLLVGLVEADRVAYVDQQQRAADARQRASLRQIDVGALESAVMENVLTLDVFRQQLQQRGFDAGDVDVLTATLAARKADRDAAQLQRDEAAKRAAIKSIDLGRLETLVRRGHRTLADYAAQLRSLGYDEGAQAAMVDLLQLQIADDTAARQAREDLARDRASKSLTLEQHRRAVVLGIETIDNFVTFLVSDGYTADAQTVLVAELQHDVAEAEAARRRREEAGAAAEAPVLPLATLARAARLGLIPPAAYQAALAGRGYSDDDIAIEMDLLVVEIADEQAARARRDELAQPADPPALSLEQLRRAVLAGLATLDDYRGRAVTIGYGPRDVQLLSHLLEDELLAQTDAQRRHREIEAELVTRNLSLSQLEATVKKGLLSVDEYVARIEAMGYGTEDAALLASLLIMALPGGGAES